MSPPHAVSAVIGAGVPHAFRRGRRSQTIPTPPSGSVLMMSEKDPPYDSAVHTN